MLMRQLAAPLTPSAAEMPPVPGVRQPLLRAGDERCPLRPGVHALGGRASDAVALAELELQPRAAILMVGSDGATTLQRSTAAVVVRVNGKPIGVAPVELQHGASIEFGACRLFFEHAASESSSTEGRTSAGPSITRPRALSLISAGAPETTEPGTPRDEPAQRAALVVARSGLRHPLPMRRIYIGRDAGCDVVVRGNAVSRRHASIAPVVGGFMLRDESANGTLVNGVRVVGTYLLGHGDVVRIQNEELRVELDEAAPAPATREEMATMLDLAHVTHGPTEELARASANRAPTASLEIVRGPFAGASFQVDRAVCSIGRGEENDVRIRDDTVSLVHATLLRKRGTWFVVDLRSMNGTFVDGSRVSGERALHPDARLRLGAVELAFRALDGGDAPPAEPPRVGLWRRIRGLLGLVAPPGAMGAA